MSDKSNFPIISWKKAQKKELQCWVTHQYILNNPEYIHFKKDFWYRLLNKLSLKTSIFDYMKVLEIGCGPSGLFLLLNKDSFYQNIYILDPLLDSYKSLFPSYFGKCHEISSSLENSEFGRNNQFDLVFAINCIDHCANIKAFLNKLKKVSHTNTMIFVSVNTHKKQWTARLWTRFQLLVDPMHPFHFTQNDYINLFQEYFQVKGVIDIEDEIIGLNNKIQTINPGIQKNMLKKIRKVLKYLKPNQLFINILNLFGLPEHDFKGKGDSVFRHKIFILGV